MVHLYGLGVFPVGYLYHVGHSEGPDDGLTFEASPHAAVTICQEADLLGILNPIDIVGDVVHLGPHECHRSVDDDFDSDAGPT